LRENRLKGHDNLAGRPIGSRVKFSEAAMAITPNASMPCPHLTPHPTSQASAPCDEANAHSSYHWKAYTPLDGAE
jgi:hypothetical protein